MAIGSTRRDVKVVVSAEATGEGKLRSLAEELRAIGTKANESAPELNRLAGELERLAASTKERRDAEAAARADATAARAALNDQRDALARLRAESTAATRATVDYQTAERAARLAIIEGRAAVREKAAALAGATAETRAAAAAERSLAEQARATASAVRASSAEMASGAGAVSKQIDAIRGQLQTLQSVAAVALGGTAIGALARDVAQTADAYRDLSARVKIATGDNDGFKASLAEVFAVAQRTGTAVEDVGALYAKLVTAGKDLNLTSADALRLAESVTQATQLSGASAQQAAASVQQFAQAIASGVLQGDELRSLLENSPRLARALADGLGVAVGKLKELGSTGALTSQQVIAALQGQSAALQAEFDRLPLTLSRAVTNLGTAWQQYLGQVAEARGATSSIAGAIDSVAKNLDTVVTLLYSAGKAAAAFTAVRLAESWLQSATAINSATVATRAATAATVAATAATVADTTARAANAAAAVAGAEAASASAGRLAGILSSLKLFGLVAVLTNLKEIGVTLGEGVARWAGYGKAMDDAERSSKAQADAARAQAQQLVASAQAAQLAADNALGLTDVSRKLIAEFEGLTRKGESTADSLTKLAKAFDLGSIKGVTEAGAALDALGQRGKLAGDQIRDALARALDGKDLGIFEANARAAFDSSTQGARRLQAALDAIGAESLKRVGSSVQELQSGFSAAMNSALNDTDALIATLDRLGAKGSEAGRLIGSSITKAIDTAGTVAAVQAIVERVEALGKAGKLTGDALESALTKARNRLDDLREGVNSTAEAFRLLGLKSSEELARVANASKAAWDQIRNDSTVTLAQKREAFAAYARSVSALAGSEAAALLEIQGKALGLSVTFDAAGKAVVRSMAEAGDAVDGFRGRMKSLGDEADRTARSLSSVYDAETKARSDRITAAGARSRQQYDPQGFAVDSNGQRITAGGQLQPPTGSGDWTFIQRTDRPEQFAESYAYVVPGVGYWQRGSGRALIRDPQSTTAPTERTSRGLAAAPPAPAPAPAASSSYPVNITVNMKTRTVATVSESDRTALVDVIRDLESAAARGG